MYIETREQSLITNVSITSYIHVITVYKFPI